MPYSIEVTGDNGTKDTVVTYTVDELMAFLMDAKAQLGGNAPVFVNVLTVIHKTPEDENPELDSTIGIVSSMDYLRAQDATEDLATVMKETFNDAQSGVFISTVAPPIFLNELDEDEENDDDNYYGNNEDDLADEDEIDESDENETGFETDDEPEDE